MRTVLHVNHQNNTDEEGCQASLRHWYLLGIKKDSELLSAVTCKSSPPGPPRKEPGRSRWKLQKCLLTRHLPGNHGFRIQGWCAWGWAARKQMGQSCSQNLNYFISEKERKGPNIPLRGCCKDKWDNWRQHSAEWPAGWGHAVKRGYNGFHYY